jgi:V/A-type H+-transporting ATPase subunit E
LAKIKENLVGIAGEVLGDVSKEAEIAIIDSEKEAIAIIDKARREAEKTFFAMVKESQDKIETERRRIKSLTEVEMRNRLLVAKEELVAAVFEMTLARLSEFVKTEKYREFLLAVIQESARKVVSKKLVVYVNSADREWLAAGNLDKLAKKLKVELVLSEKIQKSIGGVSVQSFEGKIIYDNTLENRLRLLKSTLRAEVAKLLFDEED